MSETQIDVSNERVTDKAIIFAILGLRGCRPLGDHTWNRKIFELPEGSKVVFWSSSPGVPRKLTISDVELHPQEFEAVVRAITQLVCMSCSAPAVGWKTVGNPGQPPVAKYPHCADKEHETNAFMAAMARGCR